MGVEPFQRPPELRASLEHENAGKRSVKIQSQRDQTDTYMFRVHYRCRLPGMMPTLFQDAQRRAVNLWSVYPPGVSGCYCGTDDQLSHQRWQTRNFRRSHNVIHTTVTFSIPPATILNRAGPHLFGKCGLCIFIERIKGVMRLASRFWPYQWRSAATAP